jgi:hypothetical protein
VTFLLLLRFEKVVCLITTMATDGCNIWKLLDEADFAQRQNRGIANQFGCDACGEEIVSVPLHSYRQLNIDLCDACYLKGEFLNCVDIETPDEQHIAMCMAVHPGPSCVTCGSAMTKGSTWKVISKKDDSYSNSDICMTCFASNADGLESCLKLQHIYDDSNIYAVDRCSEAILVSDKQVTDTLRIVPDAIAGKVTKKMAELWIDSMTDSIADLNPPCDEFGSVRQWCLFTELYSVPEARCDTSLAFDGINGRVASVVWDNHGRVGVDVIFKTFEEYQSAELEWRRSVAQYSEEKCKSILDDYKKSGDLSYADIAIMCKEFSGYIRLHRNLGIYYG